MKFSEIKSFYKLIASLVLAIFVYLAVQHALPKPRTMAMILMFVLTFDVWIAHWIRTNREQLPQRATAIFLRIFYLSILCFAVMILAFAITQVAYWTPILRVYGYGLMIIVVALKIVLATVWFVQFLVSRTSFLKPAASPKRWFQVGVWMVVGMFVVTLYGSVYEVFNLRVQRVEVKDQTLPKDFAGYKIVQFSDMHIGSQVAKRYVQKMVDSIHAQQPDLVVFTGDMVNFRTDEILSFVPLLSEIRAQDGVYVILGNHDYGGYQHWKTLEDSIDNVQRLLDIYHSMGWNVLSNAHVWLQRGDDSIVLAGVENYSTKKSKRGKSFADTRKALSGAELASFVVMLSHNPQHFDEELMVDYPNVNLTLTGHSHGGQMAVGFGKHKLSVARLAMHYWCGFHHVGNQYLLVNTGCGFNAFSFRINMAPSISVVTLQHTND